MIDAHVIQSLLQLSLASTLCPKKQKLGSSYISLKNSRWPWEVVQISAFRDLLTSKILIGKSLWCSYHFISKQFQSLLDDLQYVSGNYLLDYSKVSGFFTLRSNEHHQRSIAASLVQGVYVLERDRQKNKEGLQASCAPPWWESFNFQLNHCLIDVDESVFGAIYEFNSSSKSPNAPNYVIAFRGTLNTPPSISRDLKLDLLCICHRLHESSRFKLAMKFVEHIAEAYGSNIWLSGHSLGSAIALLAGKNLTKKGFFIETYLFNPPFLSTPVEIFRHPVLKTGIRFTSSVVKAALTIAIKGRNPKPGKEDPFTALSSWIPRLFVNPNDLLCSEYKGYFEHRKKMEEIGAGRIERLSTKNSIVCLFSSVVPKMSSEPLHLLPSAYLTINLSPFIDLRTAHGIQQWWDPKFNGKVELHQFN